MVSINKKNHPMKRWFYIDKFLCYCIFKWSVPFLSIQFSILNDIKLLERERFDPPRSLRIIVSVLCLLFRISENPISTNGLSLPFLQKRWGRSFPVRTPRLRRKTGLMARWRRAGNVCVGREGGGPWPSNWKTVENRIPFAEMKFLSHSIESVLEIKWWMSRGC